MTPEQTALYLELTPLARAAAGRIARIHPRLRRQQEDLEAAALWGLWRALASYRPERGAALRSWVYLRCRSEVLDWLRETDGTRLRQRPPRPLSLDELPLEPAPPAVPTHDAAEYLDELCESLQPSQRRLVMHLLSGGQQDEYAATIGVSPPRVSQLWAAIRRHCHERRAELVGAAG